MSNTAESLRRLLDAASAQSDKTGPVTDSFAQAVAQRLDEPPQWYDRTIEFAQRHEDFENAREAERQAQAEAEARKKPESAAGLLGAAIAGKRDPRTPLPLNGADVLRAALASIGTSGTINGNQTT